MVPTILRKLDEAWHAWRDARAQLVEAQAKVQALEATLRSIRELALDQGEVCAVIARRAGRALGLEAGDDPR